MSGAPGDTKKRRRLGLKRRHLIPVSAATPGTFGETIGGYSVLPVTKSASSRLQIQPSTRINTQQNDRKLTTKGLSVSEKLDMQIFELEAHIEKLRMAVKYQAQEAKLTELECKWRSAAQMAAECLLEEALARINRMGGQQEYWRRRQEAQSRERRWRADEMIQDQLSKLKETEEYKHMSLTKRKELESRVSDLSDAQTECMEREPEPHAFDMRDLFAQLGIDYGRVFAE